MAIPNHMLQLIAMHREGPGSLDVVFGRDGDFEAAPYWVGPVTDIDPSGVGGIYHVAAVLSGESIATIEGAGNNLPLYSVALDLRVPSVAARLAGLCARALGCPADAAFMADTGTPAQGFVAFRVEWALIAGRRWIWNRGTGAELSERPAGVCLPPQCDAASGLAALTLALTPRIAALRPTS